MTETDPITETAHITCVSISELPSSIGTMVLLLKFDNLILPDFLILKQKPRVEMRSGLCIYVSNMLFGTL